MREYILTDREKEILKAYLEKGLKLNGFTVLALRIKRASKKILEEANMINEFLKKLEAENKPNASSRNSQTP